MNAAETEFRSGEAPLGTWAAGLREAVSNLTVVREGEPLDRRTTLRVGGRADVWVEPADEADLSAVLAYTARRGVPILVIGRGSNLLVRDGGFRGVVISLNHAHFSQVTEVGGRLRCGAGARLKSVALQARRAGLTGLEFLEGIPGSVGGALRMNAGAHGGAFFDAVVEVRMLDRQGGIHVMAGSGMGAVYRACPMLDAQVAVEVLLEGQPGDSARIDERMQRFSRQRWASQPAAPSAGCIFKNPDSIPAGRLVDELGLKGFHVGGAMVSHEHGNFIVTDGQATAADVLALIAHIRERALRERGIELETEVRIVGEEAPRS